MTAPSRSFGVPTGARTSRVRAATRHKMGQILATAAALVREKGFEATSMREMARSVGVSLAGLYHYFESKEELLYQIQFRTFESLLAAQEEIAAREGTPEERLRRLVVGHLAFFAEHPNELKVCTYEHESLRGELYKSVAALRRRYFRLMVSAVAELTGGCARDAADRHSRHVTMFIFGMLNWIFMWYDPLRHGPVEQIGTEMLDLIMHGVRDRRP